MRPRTELPLDTRVVLVVEPGLEPAEGTELGDESRVVVEFYTFPRFAFLGVRCSDLGGDELVSRSERDAGAVQSARRSRA